MTISRMLQPRQQYGLGSLVKSAVKGVTGAVKGVASGIKDFAKSDLGKAALIGAAAFGLPGTSFGGLFGRAGFGGSAMGLFGKEGIAATLGGLGIPGSGAAGEYLKTKGGKTLAIAGAGTLLGGVLSKAEQGDPEAMATVRDVGALKTYLTSGYENLGYSPEEIDTLVQKDLSEYKSIGGYAYGGRVQYGEGSPFKFSREPEPKTDLMKAAEKMAGEKGIPVNKALKMLMEKNFQKDVTYRAMGGRVKYSNGTPSESDRVKELMDDGYTFGEAVKKVMEEQKQRENKASGSKPEDNAKRASGIMNIPLNKNKAGVTELDMRENGGFIPPVGVKEKADDIPAMLSNNEFVFTADAVRGMGNGNVNVGAQRMYDMMKKLENRMA